MLAAPDCSSSSDKQAYSIRLLPLIALRTPLRRTNDLFCESVEGLHCPDQRLSPHSRPARWRNGTPATRRGFRPKIWCSNQSIRLAGGVSSDGYMMYPAMPGDMAIVALDAAALVEYCRQAAASRHSYILQPRLTNCNELSGLSATDSQHSASSPIVARRRERRLDRLSAHADGRFAGGQFRGGGNRRAD